jgi:glycosyltransferase involved in cell wall biosynthesis
MKLLFVSHRSDVSGGEICLQRILERLSDHEIRMVLPEGRFAEKLRAAGIAVHIENSLTRMAREEDVLSVFRLAARFPGVVSRLRRAINDFGADLVISNALGPLPYAAPAAKLAKVRNVCIHHHPVLTPGTMNGRVVSLMAKGCDGFIAVSDAMNRGLQSVGVPAARIKTIYNGLDVASYVDHQKSPGLLHAKFNLKDDVALIGLVATISASKGHHVVIEAARILRDSFSLEKPWRMVFVGGVFENSAMGAAYQKRLEKQISDHHLQDHVLFAGKQENMIQVYSDLSLVLNASTEPEPLGTTIYEAMAMGKPVIATSLGGSPEIVDGGRAGFLVAAGDSRELAELLANILQGKIDCAPCLSAARSRVEQCFDLRNTVREYEAYFASFCPKPAAVG